MLTNIITEEQITQTKQLIDNARQITILTHISPDGDALGSSLGLWWFLKGIGKKAKIVVPNKFPEFLAWMPGSEEIVVALDENGRRSGYDIFPRLQYSQPYQLVEKLSCLLYCPQSTHRPPPISRYRVRHLYIVSRNIFDLGADIQANMQNGTTTGHRSENCRVYLHGYDDRHRKFFVQFAKP